MLQLACNAGADAAAQLARMVDKHRCRPHRVAPPPALQTDWRGLRLRRMEGSTRGILVFLLLKFCIAADKKVRGRWCTFVPFSLLF